jgi:GAF domain-containing protein
MNHYTEDLIIQVDSWLLQTEVNMMLQSDKNLQEILTEIVTWIEYKSKNDIFTSVLLYNNETGQLFVGAAPSLPDHYNRACNGIKAAAVAASCGTAAFFRKQIIVDDIATDPLWKDFKSYALVEDLRSCWSTPIINAKEELLGTFAVYYTEPRKPSEHDLSIIDEIVDITAAAIEARKEDFQKMVWMHVQ